MSNIITNNITRNKNYYNRCQFWQYMSLYRCSESQYRSIPNCKQALKTYVSLTKCYLCLIFPQFFLLCPYHNWCIRAFGEMIVYTAVVYPNSNYLLLCFFVCVYCITVLLSPFLVICFLYGSIFIIPPMSFFWYFCLLYILFMYFFYKVSICHFVFFFEIFIWLFYQLRS